MSKLRGLTLAYKGIGYPLKGLSIFRRYVFGSDKPPRFKPVLAGSLIANQPLSTMRGIQAESLTTQVMATASSNFILTVKKEPVFTLEAEEPSNVEWFDN